jgi:hypothetical protein
MLIIVTVPNLSGDEQEPDEIDEEGEQEQDDDVNLLFLAFS